jgi:hypothetical protein
MLLAAGSQCSRLLIHECWCLNGTLTFLFPNGSFLPPSQFVRHECSEPDTWREYRTPRLNIRCGTVTRNIVVGASEGITGPLTAHHHGSRQDFDTEDSVRTIQKLYVPHTSPRARIAGEQSVPQVHEAAWQSHQPQVSLTHRKGFGRLKQTGSYASQVARS